MEGTKQFAINAAIESAVKCGIVITLTLSSEEGGFPRVSARFASDTTRKPRVFLRTDPVMAIQSAVTELMKKLEVKI